MIRTITRPSTAKCTLSVYIGFLLSEPALVSCCRLSDVMNISHDSANRFLNREFYTPYDLFNEVKASINLHGGCLSVDDSVLDKPHAKYICEFEKLHDLHWQIEQYHRTIKQVCNIEHFQVRSEVAVKNHIFAAICGYVKLQKIRATDVIKNCYRLQRDLFNQVIETFIKEFAPGLNHMNPQFYKDVNA
jgi:hypothetical protein